MYICPPVAYGKLAVFDLLLLILHILHCLPLIFKFGVEGRRPLIFSAEPIVIQIFYNVNILEYRQNSKPTVGNADSGMEMAEHFLVSVDLDADDVLHFDTESAAKPPSTQGISLQTISYLARVHIQVNSENYHAAISFIQKNCTSITTYCDVTALTNITEIISLLDYGAVKVFVSRFQLEQVVEQGVLEDLGRLIIALDQTDGNSRSASAAEKSKVDIEALIDSVPVAIQINDVDEWKWLNKSQKDSQSNKKHPQRYVKLTNFSLQSYIQTVHAGDIPIVPANTLTIDSEAFPHLIAAHRLITAVVISDRSDGLFPTVVSDERGICLGLVYSDEKSIECALNLGRGVYHSRSRNGLWIKGEESGDVQELINIGWDCDADTLRFIVKQKGDGFCHLKSATCFGAYAGLSRLQEVLQLRKFSSPIGSYTARLFKEPKLLEAKIMEEASELCQASTREEVVAEAADLFYFALTRCVAAGVDVKDIEDNLDRKGLKTTRRKGDAKKRWAEEVGLNNSTSHPLGMTKGASPNTPVKDIGSIPKTLQDPMKIDQGRIRMQRYRTRDINPKVLQDALQRPSQKSTDEIMKIVGPIIKDIRDGGDSAVLKYTHKFEKAMSLTSPVLHAPFPAKLMELSPSTINAIDLSFENIRRFHEAQKEEGPLVVETMPGVVCSRFSRPIERVGLYVPGGTAVLPSTAMMLGVPAMVAGCKKIILASPPRSDGSLTPEIVYVAHKIGAESIVLAGGAQAVAALAYGTESICKVDKILGPGNQFVTAGKMLVSNDTTASVSIDMPAGPSEVLVIADKTARPSFVASDLLSQAEHGTDSQVILIAINLDEEQLTAIEVELQNQANALPRVDIVRGAIEHSVTLLVEDIEEAMAYSNQYAPEHLILQVENAEAVVDLVQNAGSVFVGHWTPESVGDYSAGVNHSLPTYGYAKQYSGVNLSSFTKHITSSNLTKQGLRNVGGAVMQMATIEELEAHRRAVSIRLRSMAGE